MLCKHYFDKYIPDNAVIVDVGAGYCEFINNIASTAKVKQKIAIDINEDVALFANPDVTVCRDDCMNISSLESGTADIIFMSNFLEHMPSKNDILALFGECRRILRPGGKLLIMQPNIRLVGGAYWDYIDHHIPLTEKSLTEALELTGLTVTKCVTRFLPFTTKSALPQHPLLVRLYLMCPFVWFFMGKQSFMMATPNADLE